MQIRKAVIIDAKKISNLIKPLTKKFICHECTAEGSIILLNSMSEAAIEDYLKSAYIYYLAEMDNRLVGVIGIKENTHIYHLFVKQNYQNQHVATELLKAAGVRGEQSGVSAPFTVNSSSYALAFYKKLGFIAQSEVILKNGIPSIALKFDG